MKSGYLPLIVEQGRQAPVPEAVGPSGDSVIPRKCILGGPISVEQLRHGLIQLYIEGFSLQPSKQDPFGSIPVAEGIVAPTDDKSLLTTPRQLVEFGKYGCPLGLSEVTVGAENLRLEPNVSRGQRVGGNGAYRAGVPHLSKPRKRRSLRPSRPAGNGPKQRNQEQAGCDERPLESLPKPHMAQPLAQKQGEKNEDKTELKIDVDKGMGKKQVSGDE